MNVRISMSIAAVLLGCLLNVAVAAQHAPGAEAAYARLQEVERASASPQYRVRAQQIVAAYRDLFAHDMTPEAMPRHDDAISTNSSGAQVGIASASLSLPLENGPDPMAAFTIY